MTNQSWKMKERVLRALLVSILITLGVNASCVVKPTTRPADRAPQQMEVKPQETPVPFESTKENEGKRCEARYYFGSRRTGSDEGYSPFCYKLQLRLMKAAREGSLSEIRETLKFGANPNLPVDDSFPPLQTAAASGQADAARLLLDNGAEVNHVADFENTALNTAASYGHMDVVRVLLERGADVCYGRPGGTAGDIARARGHKELADLLNASETTKCK
jgi:uncharacterized protein